MKEENIRLSENLIIADADYIDRVAFLLSVQFERMLGRRIPPADLSQWAVCTALDGGLRPGDHETQLVLVHDPQRTRMENFVPADYAADLNGRAFRDEQLGEFIVNAYATNDLASKADYLTDLLQTAVGHREVKRIMLIPDAEDGETYERVRRSLHDADTEGKRVTVFAMQPMAGGNFQQEILGYSLMNALGIKANEIK